MTSGWSAGFTIPTYTVACSTQPSLLTGSGNAAANSTSIQNALNSCDATHNVVNVPAGTWYVSKISFGTQGKQVLRGAGPNSTIIELTAGTSCGGGLNTGVCMVANNVRYNGSPEVQPPSGTQQCLWTSGYSQGTTAITVNTCPGGAPAANQMVILDQANDSSDTGGVYICDTNIAGCGYEGSTGGNNNGRSISGVTHSEQQVDYVTAVTGSGPWTVTLAVPVYFTNIRSGQSPGIWWQNTVSLDGLESMTLDGTGLDAEVSLYGCYQCWVKGVRGEHGGRNHINLTESMSDVVRDSYFYAAQGSASDSYAIEFDAASASLVENNIFQQVTTPIMFGAGTGNVIDYNFNVDVNYSCGGSCPTFGNGAYASHNAGNNMNLFEGNNFWGVWGDDAWGSSDQDTAFRNMFVGWQSGKSQSTIPVLLRSYVRGFNYVGNVMGQAGYHTSYQTYASSTTVQVGGPEATAIYSLGFSGIDSCGGTIACDPKVPSTLMRWGNWDVVNNATQWNSTEASPGAVTYLNANFTSSYFTSLAHTLPSSLIYSSAPSWWTSGKAFPAVGPDVSTGNVGTCSGGTYAGAQATSSGQCTGGTLSTAWASHVISLPAQDCYLTTLAGPPDGSGSVLAFDASTCYSTSTTTPGSPTLLMAKLKSGGL